MTVRVQFMAQLRTAVGRADSVVELPAGRSLFDLLVHLTACHKSTGTHLVTESGQACPSLLIVVNEAAVSARDAARMKLCNGDVVTLLPPIAGG